MLKHLQKLICRHKAPEPPHLRDATLAADAGLHTLLDAVELLPE